MAATLVDSNVIIDVLTRDFLRAALPWEAGFLAGKAFLEYKRRKGSQPAILPDFYIGAHAAVEGWVLLTRDLSRYRTAYPRLQLIAP